MNTHKLLEIANQGYMDAAGDGGILRLDDFYNEDGELVRGPSGSYTDDLFAAAIVRELIESQGASELDAAQKLSDAARAMQGYIDLLEGVKDALQMKENLLSLWQWHEFTPDFDTTDEEIMTPPERCEVWTRRIEEACKRRAVVRYVGGKDRPDTDPSRIDLYIEGSEHAAPRLELITTQRVLVVHWEYVGEAPQRLKIGQGRTLRILAALERLEVNG